MKVSVITVVYNDIKHIECCIKSIISQSYPNIEYIIIDGKSSDGTLDVISHYKNKITKITSEKDEGYVDAMNKGLRMATGDIIGFLHSDDFYAQSSVIEDVVEVFKKEDTDSVYGDLVYVSQNDTEKIIRYWKSGNFAVEKIKNGWMPPHPALFIKRKVYEKYDFLDKTFKIAADYELILRFLYKNRISTHYMPKTLVKMRWGGISNKSIKNIFKKSMEDYKICKRYGLSVTSLIKKNIIKLPQFLKK